jgi:hypothetical protein
MVLFIGDNHALIFHNVEEPFRLAPDLTDWLRSLFFNEEMEITLVGLESSGKTTFVRVITVCSCALA